MSSSGSNGTTNGAQLPPDVLYAIDCELNESVSKSDALRSQLIHLSAKRDEFTDEEYQHFRLKLMNALNTEMDRRDGKNSYIHQEMFANHLSQRSDQSAPNGFESHLYRLSAQELCQRLGVEYKDSDNDCEIVEVVLKPSMNTTDDTNDAHRKRDQKKPFVSIPAKSGKPTDEVIYNCGQNLPKTDLLRSVGSFRSGYKENTASTSSASNRSQLPSNPCPIGSPTRISGLFRKNSPKNGYKSGESGSETSGKRPAFMSGFEKKVVDEVKKGSMDVSKARQALKQMKNSFKNPIKQNNTENEEPIDPHLKNIDPNLIEVIENEIITALEPINWSDVAGLEFAKNKIQEIAVLPLLRPDLFRGLRKPPKGILLFGPPGTGKTFLGRCIASQTKSTFFSITVSALNSKWIGEGEKTIRAMFAVARARQPSVIFIDEIDSLLKTRCDSEHESSRRMKTEFLAQFEGVGTVSDEKLLIIGATNRPQELDDAARRRLSAKLYIRLPDASARKQIIENCIKTEKHCLREEQMQSLADQTDGYSCADMRDLCRESAMEPMRDSIIMSNITDISVHEIRCITFEDFVKNLSYVKPTVRKEDISMFEKWNHEFGTNCRQN